VPLEDRLGDKAGFKEGAEGIREPIVVGPSGPEEVMIVFVLFCSV